MDIERRLGNRASIRKRVRGQIAELDEAARRLASVVPAPGDSPAHDERLPVDEEGLRKLFDEIAAGMNAHAAATLEISTVDALIDTTEATIDQIKGAIMRRVQLQDRLDELIKRRDELARRERTLRWAAGLVLSGVTTAAVIFWLLQ